MQQFEKEQRKESSRVEEEKRKKEKERDRDRDKEEEELREELMKQQLEIMAEEDIQRREEELLALWEQEAEKDAMNEVKHTRLPVF